MSQGYCASQGCAALHAALVMLQLAMRSVHRKIAVCRSLCDRVVGTRLRVARVRLEYQCDAQTCAMRPSKRACFKVPDNATRA